MQRSYGPSGHAKVVVYIRVIDAFARAMKTRVRKEPPRTWAQFWRVWSDEQLTQRQYTRALCPNPMFLQGRDGAWDPITRVAEAN
jgi:tRNA A37 threonylcarbamoyladenosine dehydratase